MKYCQPSCNILPLRSIRSVQNFALKHLQSVLILNLSNRRNIPPTVGCNKKPSVSMCFPLVTSGLCYLLSWIIKWVLKDTVLIFFQYLRLLVNHHPLLPRSHQLSFSKPTLVLKSTSVMSVKCKRDNLVLGFNTTQTREKQLRIPATAGTLVNLHGLLALLILNQYYTTLPIISSIGSHLCSNTWVWLLCSLARGKQLADEWMNEWSVNKWTNLSLNIRGKTCEYCQAHGNDWIVQIKRTSQYAIHVLKPLQFSDDYNYHL
jgi:hypothetical protein